MGFEAGYTKNGNFAIAIHLPSAVVQAKATTSKFEQSLGHFKHAIIDEGKQTIETEETLVETQSAVEGEILQEKSTVETEGPMTESVSPCTADGTSLHIWFLLALSPK